MSADKRFLAGLLWVIIGNTTDIVLLSVTAHVLAIIFLLFSFYEMGSYDQT